MSEPADGERAAAVREAALRPALCPQPDTPAQGNLGREQEHLQSDGFALRSSAMSLFAPRINTWALAGWADLCTWDAEERSSDWLLFVVSRVLYCTGKSNHSCCMKDCRRRSRMTWVTAG